MDLGTGSPGTSLGEVGEGSYENQWGKVLIFACRVSPYGCQVFPYGAEPACLGRSGSMWEGRGFAWLKKGWTRSGVAGLLGFHKARCHGIFGEVRDGVEIQLYHDPVAVCLDRFVTEGESICNLFRHISFRNKPKDEPFPIREIRCHISS